MGSTEDAPVTAAAGPDLGPLAEKLIGSSPKGWFARCCDAVAAGPDTTTHLTSLLVAGTDECTALMGAPGEFGQALTADTRQGPLSDEEEAAALTDEPIDPVSVRTDRHPHLWTARALASLAEALTGQRPYDEVAQNLLDHADRSGTHSVGTQLLPAGTNLTTDAGPLGSIVLQLLQNPSRSRGYAVLCAMRMSGMPLKGRQTEVRVLFRTIVGTTRDGEVGTLRLTLLKHGPSGLHPDPSMMSFLQADDVFISSLNAAWATSTASSTDACVIWSVRLGSGYPALSIVGNSLGAAFAVALDDLAPKYALSRFARPKKIDEKCAVTAGLDGATLTPVVGYSAKFAAAQHHSLRVVVAEDALEDARSQARVDYTSKVTGAATLPDAIHQTRSRPNHLRNAAVLALLLLIGIGSWGVNTLSEARHESTVSQLASKLISRSGELTNTDSRAAALLALAANELRPTPESRNAMLNVVQNNQAVVASTQADDTSPIFNIAASDDTMLTSGRSNIVKVWAMPRDGVGLRQLEDIHVDTAPIGMASLPSQQWFAMLDRQHVNIFQGAPGRTPALVKTLRTPSTFSTANQRKLYGPIIDSESGALLALDEDFHGLYWSPGMADAQTFTLDTNASLQRPARITAVGGFGSLPGWRSGPPQEAIGGGSGPAVRSALVATTQRQLLRVEITRHPGGAPATFGFSGLVSGSDVPAPITALSYAEGANIAIGTENGIQMREIGGSAKTQFPYGGLTEHADTMLPNSQAQNKIIVSSPSGIRMVEQSGSTPLNNVNSGGAGSSTGVITSLSRTESGLVVVGRIDGRALILNPGNRIFGVEDRPRSNVVAFGSGNTLLTTSSDGPQQSSYLGLSRVPATSQRTAVGDRSQEADAVTYKLPSEGPRGTRPYVNSAVLSDNLVAASGMSNYSAQGQLWMWDRTTGDLLRTLTFSNPSDTDRLDIVSAVALAPKLDRIIALNPRKGQIGVWSTTTGEQVATFDIGDPKTTYGAVGATHMSTSADGTRVAVSFYDAAGDMQVRVFNVEHLDQIAAPAFGPEAASAELSSDGTQLAVSTSQRVTRHTLDGTPSSPTVDFRTEISAMVWSPDGGRLAVALRDSRQIAFVETQSMALQGSPWATANESAPYKLAWSPDGQFIAMTIIKTSSNKSTPEKVQILRTAPPDYHSALCAIAGKDFTDAEWSNYSGDIIKRPSLCPA